MEMRTVKSATVKRMGYEPEVSTMRVEFHSGATYDYQNCTHEEFISVVNAESIGKKLREVTKGKPYKKV